MIDSFKGEYERKLMGGKYLLPPVNFGLEPGQNLGIIESDDNNRYITLIPNPETESEIITVRSDRKVLIKPHKPILVPRIGRRIFDSIIRVPHLSMDNIKKYLQGYILVAGCDTVFEAWNLADFYFWRKRNLDKRTELYRRIEF